MTILDRPITQTVTVDQQPAHPQTGERPTTIHYDPAILSAVAHLVTPTHSARFMLGAAGYSRHQTTATGEIWVRPTHPPTADQESPTP